MIRKAICILLVFVTLSSGFTKLFLYMGYELNKNYITNTFCENKAKPIMQCQGKCYLTKKIKQAEQSEQKQEKSSKHFFVEAFFTSADRFKYFTSQIDEFLSPNTLPYSLISDISIFHPPKSV